MPIWFWIIIGVVLLALLSGNKGSSGKKGRAWIWNKHTRTCTDCLSCGIMNRQDDRSNKEDMSL